jgi:hypothetical protein
VPANKATVRRMVFMMAGDRRLGFTGAMIRPAPEVVKTNVQKMVFEPVNWKGIKVRMRSGSGGGEG